MSLDDERMPWPAVEAIERGRNPQRPDNAQFKLARLLSEHDDLHSIHHQMIVASRVLAFLPRIVAWHDAEQAKPKTKQPGQLRQFSSQSDEDEALERAHYHLAGYREAMASLAAMGSVYAKDHDADDRGVREDERVAREERHDERAVQDAPRMVG